MNTMSPFQLANISPNNVEKDLLMHYLVEMYKRDHANVIKALGVTKVMYDRNREAAWNNRGSAVLNEMRSKAPIVRL